MTATNQNLIQIICENNNVSLFVKEGTTLAELLDMLGLQSNEPYLAAYVDNKMQELYYRIFTAKSVRFVSISNIEGMRTYTRSLFFLLQKAVFDLYPDSKMRMMHSIGHGGYYCELIPTQKLQKNEVEKIKERMQQLVNQDLPIARQDMPLQEAEQLYVQHGFEDKLAMMRTRPRFFVPVYNMAGLPGNFYGALVPSTGYLKAFDLLPFGDGMVILMPDPSNPAITAEMRLQPKLFDVFKLNKEWMDILQIPNVSTLNEKVIAGQSSELIKIGEALQEKNFAHIADMILEKHNTEGVKIVLIAGPSSSGKTTFSKRLAVQLRVLGLIPHMISLDNYFVNRDKTPRDEQGNYDFEALEALDIEEFNKDLLRLFAGEKIKLAKYSFHTGERYYDGDFLQIEERGVLIVEGIHALNPALTPEIGELLKYKIYVSALTTLSIDNMTMIHTTDNRLLRRMVRDNEYRNRSAYETLAGWASVRRGEDKHIFPFQEQADVMFNTALFFEFPILKHYALPLLVTVPATTPEYAEALRLMNFLDCFAEISDHELPPTSILREFIGQSSFIY